MISAHSAAIDRVHGDLEPAQVGVAKDPLDGRDRRPEALSDLTHDRRRRLAVRSRERDPDALVDRVPSIRSR